MPEKFMRQLQFRGYGPLREVLEIADVDMPAPGPRDVVIRVFAACINPIDYKMVEGALRQIHKVRLPSPIGFDCCGEVDEVGSEVTQFRKGDRVYTRLPRKRVGSIAEFAIAEEQYVSHAPSNLTAVECASLPLVSLTTIQGLVDRAHARPGQKILIHAGSGGVGSIAVQYAKHELDLNVTTTTSSANAKWVRDIGADKVIEYDRENFVDGAKDYDIVFDTLGGNTTFESFKVLKPGGNLISIMGPPTPAWAKQMELGLLISFFVWRMGSKVRKVARATNTNYFYYFTESSGKQLQHMADVVEAGKVRAVVDSVFPFEKAVDAMVRASEGHTKGKVVIQVVPD